MDIFIPPGTLRTFFVHKAILLHQYRTNHVLTTVKKFKQM
jgi:hypothetical protein